jgi:hypothetical protein
VGDRGAGAVLAGFDAVEAVVTFDRRLADGWETTASA